MIIILTLWNFLFVPYDFAYESGSSTIIDVVETMIDVVFIIDIIINFRTAYLSPFDHALITKPSKIALNYLLSARFYIDVLASLPYDLIILIIGLQSDAFRLLKVLKLSRLFRISRLIRLLRPKLKIRAAMQIIVMILFLL